MKMEQIECSETSAYKIQTPRNHPEENIQHTEHGESLKSKICLDDRDPEKCCPDKVREVRHVGGCSV
jgi:hypothetical protein